MAVYSVLTDFFTKNFPNTSLRSDPNNHIFWISPNGKEYEIIAGLKNGFVYNYLKIGKREIEIGHNDYHNHGEWFESAPNAVDEVKKALQIEPAPNSIILLAEYQLEQQRTANTDTSERERLANACLGLAGETGETIDHVKKHLFHGHEIDMNKIGYELGDVLWYLSELCSALGFSLEDIANRNADKLRRRYPDGFSATRSKERTER